MASQITQLLLETAQQIRGVEATLTAQSQTLHELRMHCDSLLQRVAMLERDNDWSGKERRKVDARLGSGDHTFKRVEAKAQAAWDIAEEAIGLAQELQKLIDKLIQNVPQKETGLRKKVKKLALEALIPMAIGFVWWAVYHLLLIGPEIARLMKAAKDAGGHP